MSLIPNFTGNDNQDKIIGQDLVKDFRDLGNIVERQVIDSELLTLKLVEKADVEAGPYIVALFKLVSMLIPLAAIRAVLTDDEYAQLEARCPIHREIKLTARQRASVRQSPRPSVRHAAYQKYPSLISQSELRTHHYQQQQCIKLAKLRAKLLQQLLSGAKVVRSHYDLKIKRLAYPVFTLSTLTDVFEPQRAAVIMSAIPLCYRYRVVIEHVGFVRD